MIQPLVTSTYRLEIGFDSHLAAGKEKRNPKLRMVCYCKENKLCLLN